MDNDIDILYQKIEELGNDLRNAFQRIKDLEAKLPAPEPDREGVTVIGTTYAKDTVTIQPSAPETSLVEAVDLIQQLRYTEPHDTATSLWWEWNNKMNHARLNLLAAIEGNGTAQTAPLSEIVALTERQAKIDNGELQPAPLTGDERRELEALRGLEYRVRNILGAQTAPVILDTLRDAIFNLDHAKGGGNA